MKKIKFISFLGIGPDGEGYSEIDYKWENQEKTIKTEFVQRAEIEFIGKDQFEKIFILCTDESKNFFHDLNYELRDELNIDAASIIDINIGKIDQTESAWNLFAKINQLISRGDTLVFDFTHGFRSLSIIMSTALNYILKAKGDIHLKHVLYGEMAEKAQNYGRIIDMKSFYIINEWAEGVARLIEDADATKLATLSHDADHYPFHHLNDGKMVGALNSLTDTLRNIDVNRIARNAGNALDIITNRKAETSGPEKELLTLIENKFRPLAAKSTGRYDSAYFHLQIQIIRMLNQHKLYMQAFTVMRELIGSIGMLGAPNELTDNMWDNKAADGREIYAGLFVRMMNFRGFNAKPNEQMRHNELVDSICRKLEQIGVQDKLKEVTKNILNIRNPFDHAWTAKGDAALEKIGGIETLAEEAVIFFENLIRRMIDHNIIQQG